MKAFKGVTLYIILGAVVLLILLLSMAAPIVTTGADFSVYNPNWNGCSHFAVKTYEAGKFTPNLQLSNEKDIQLVDKDITSYDLEPVTSTLVFLGPKTDFTGNEADYVHRYLMNGGTVMLADDFGSANTLLSGLNTSSRFDGNLLLDMSFEKKPDFGVAYQIEDHPITDGVYLLMMNRPTVLKPDKEATVLVQTSRASWLDKDEDGVYDENEPSGSFPVLSVEDYGRGELILLSDPSIMINSMLDKVDNQRFVDNLLAYVSEDKDEVVFDESHRDVNVVFNIVYVMSYPKHALSTIFVLTALVGTMVVLDPNLKEHTTAMIKRVLSLFDKEQKKDIIAQILNNHPEWDENKLKMIYDNFVKGAEEN